MLYIPLEDVCAAELNSGGGGGGDGGKAIE